MFRRILLRWYKQHKRVLPWRRTRDPYRVLLSEIMLQQTQASRVREKYPPFLKQFPTILALARATNAQVILAWRGMGYNNRALRLRELARQVIEHHDGMIPDNAEVLMGLPGIGRYTAHAVASFAFGQPLPVVEVNVRRVLSRIFWRMRHTDDLQEEKKIWKFAAAIVPARIAADWNQALMDFGATVCSSRPRCVSCPMTQLCASYRSLSTAVGWTLGRRRPREVLYDGLPVRIYRGRIVEALRRLDGTACEVGSLGKMIKPVFLKSELPWLRSLLRKLEGEGLATVHRQGTSAVVSLPNT